MAGRPYRVEMVYPTRGKPTYYLVRDVTVGNYRRKVRKYLGTEAPTKQELEQYRGQYASEMELKAALKKAEISCERYSSEFLSQKAIRELEEVRWLYNGVLDLLTTTELKAYEQAFEISYIQGTTAIEGNTLTRSEAADLLEHGIAPKGRSLREINEVQNFRNVVRYRNKYRGRVTIEFIKQIHALVMANIDFESAGKFRRIDDVSISGCDLAVGPSATIQDDLEDLARTYYADLEKGRSPFELAALFHYHFEMIHPFTDGNGRVGREVLNYMLAREKYPRLLFLGKDREQYIGALKLGNQDKFGEMLGVFASIIVNQRMSAMKERLSKITAVSAPRPRRSDQTTLGLFVQE